MKKILQLLFEHKTLNRQLAKEVLVNIGKGVYNEHEVTAFMTVYLMRSITIEELQGFRDALLELCVAVDLNDFETIDIVGTGGDGKDTFNISTLSCFIVAGTGQKVAKHGNYGASSISGASNVMEQLGYKFKNNNDQLKNGGGYDHNYVLRGAKANGLTHAATVTGDKSGIQMDVYTTEPGLQFYGGNFMQAKNTFKSGAKDEFRTAFCLETQHFPDSPNQPQYPSTILDPGKRYTSESIYKFSSR